MSSSLRHLPRYLSIARLVARHGRALARLPDDLLSEIGAEPEEKGAISEAEAFARDLEALGPTFVKLGQLLSSRADILPTSYLDALARLQDNVAPFPFAEVEKIVERELGVRLSKGFTDFESEPLAAASLGQVHRATLRDGRVVAVKVQRPGIDKAVAEDFEILTELAGFLDRHTAMGRRLRLPELLVEFRRTLVRELDYREEASNLVEMGRCMEPYPRILVPQPVADYTTRRILTMDFVRGTKVTRFSPVARTEIDAAGLADELLHAYLRQILVAGQFHADPHPGNIFLTEDGRLALLDLGMVGRLPAEKRDAMLQLLLSAVEGKAEEVSRILLDLAETGEEFDAARFRGIVVEQISRFGEGRAEPVALGRVVFELTHESARADVRLPPELLMLGKTLLQLDEIARALDPAYDPNAAFRRHAAEITAQHWKRQLSPAGLLSAAGDMKQFVERLPGRANRILDRIADNELEIKVKAIDERLLTEGFQKVANRIASGLVLAALIVGAAMMMRVETPFRILGYPGLAMLLFLAATAGGGLLLGQILLNDRRSAPPRRR